MFARCVRKTFSVVFTVSIKCTNTVKARFAFSEAVFLFTVIKYIPMGKAKMFGGAAILFGLILGLLAAWIVPNEVGFLHFLIYTYLPVLLVTVGLIAIIIGVLLLVYG
jgi:hypothetical protein